MELKQLENLISEKLNELSYELVSLKTRKDKSGVTLEVIVDRVEPIDMAAIVEISNALNAYIDEIDPFDFAYTLDISSLGAEKPLKIESLNSYVNSYVNVHLINPIDGENIYEGTLKEVNEENILLEIRIKSRSKIVDITKSNISKIRLAIKF